MNVLLYIFGALAVVSGFFISLLAKTSIHEIQAYILYLVGAVLFSGAIITSALHELLDFFVKRETPKPLAKVPSPVTAPISETIAAPRQVNPNQA